MSEQLNVSALLELIATMPPAPPDVAFSSHVSDYVPRDTVLVMDREAVPGRLRWPGLPDNDPRYVVIAGRPLSHAQQLAAVGMFLEKREQETGQRL